MFGAHKPGHEHKVHKDANQLAEERTQMAIMRTLMAANRTLMAWVRTGVSLISFGFTIYKILDSYMQEGKIGAKVRVLTPEEVGIIFIVLGIGAICFGLIEYRITYKEFNQKIKRLPAIMAGLIVVLGLAFIVAVTLGW